MDNLIENDPKVSIIAMAPNEWEGPWMNRQQLLSRIVQNGWAVVYTTDCISLWDRGGERWRKTKWFNCNVATDGVTVSIPGKTHVRWPKYKLYNNQVLRSYADKLKVLAGWNNKDNIRIAFLFHPTFYPYIEYLNPDYVAYHIYDLHSGMPGTSTQIEMWEKALIDRCDLLTVTSNIYAEKLGEQGQKKSRILGNGVDTTLFKPLKEDEPEDLRDIPKPRIGYTGALNNKIDWETINVVAEKCQSWHWVFIGPMKTANITDPAQVDALMQCQKRKNIHFLGQKHRKEIPNYINHLNVGAICYRVKEKDWVFYGYPLKLHEYLACGKPVVCSALPAVMGFKDIIEIPSTSDEWLLSLERCLASETNEKDIVLRVKVAKENSWDIRADELGSYINSII